MNIFKLYFNFIFLLINLNIQFGECSCNEDYENVEKICVVIICI